MLDMQHHRLLAMQYRALLMPSREMSLVPGTVEVVCGEMPCGGTMVARCLVVIICCRFVMCRRADRKGRDRRALRCRLINAGAMMVNVIGGGGAGVCVGQQRVSMRQQGLVRRVPVILADLKMARCRTMIESGVIVLPRGEAMICR